MNAGCQVLMSNSVMVVVNTSRPLFFKKFNKNIKFLLQKGEILYNAIHKAQG